MSLSFVHLCVPFDIRVFQTVKDVRTLNPLVDFLESIELLLKHLDIYTKIPPTTVVTGIVLKTLVELLSILALATSLIKQGRPGAFLGLPPH
jgi:ABC-type enterochelin transport system permease subunit